MRKVKVCKIVLKHTTFPTTAHGARQGSIVPATDNTVSMQIQLLMEQVAKLQSQVDNRQNSQTPSNFPKGSDKVWASSSSQSAFQSNLPHSNPYQVATQNSTTPNYKPNFNIKYHRYTLFPAPDPAKPRSSSHATAASNKYCLSSPRHICLGVYFAEQSN